jgi:hypothetical protein
MGFLFFVGSLCEFSTLQLRGLAVKHVDLSERKRDGLYRTVRRSWLVSCHLLSLYSTGFTPFSSSRTVRASMPVR